MNLNFLCLALLFRFASSASRSSRTAIASAGNSNSGRPTAPRELPKISHEDAVNIYMMTTQQLEAFIMRKKYELGEKMLRIVHNMQFASRDQQENTTDNQTETDIGKSFEIAGSYLKAYEEKGWAEISANVRTAPGFIKSKLLILAINNENMALVKELVDSKLVKIDKGHYERAITVYREKGTEALETIIDMIVLSNPELGSGKSMHHKLHLGLAMTEAVKWIMDNDYPMLERALNEGTLKVNTVFPKLGSLLGVSVMNKCARCVKILVERDADVNAPILASKETKFEFLQNEISPFGWTPLMVAVANGDLRIIKYLIESERAFVTRTPKGREDERFHARAVARLLNAEQEAISRIYDMLKLNSIEKEIILARTNGKCFVSALRENNFQLTDDFLLLKPEKDLIPQEIEIDLPQCHDNIAHLIQFEFLSTRN